MSKLSDVLSLIKSGYTKKEIEELYKNNDSETKPETKPESDKETELPTINKRLVDNNTVEQVNELISGLTKEVEELRKAQQSINRERLSGGDDNKPQTVNDILSGILDSNESDK